MFQNKSITQKNGFRGMLTLSHITAKGVQVEACYTGETIRC
jgi:hypothetical protein